MMQMHERMFKAMFESVLSSVNTRIDEVVKSEAELRASLQNWFPFEVHWWTMIEDDLDDI